MEDFQLTQSSFSLAKLFYSLILVALIALLLAELNRLWFDRTLYVRPFGQEDDAEAQDFTRRVVNAHAELLHKFAVVDAAARGSGGRDEPWERRFRGALRPNLDAPIENSRSLLSDMSLEIQKINVTDILARLRRWVGSPREVKGSISKDGAEKSPTYSANVTVSGDDGQLAGGRQVGPTMHFANFASSEALAFNVACSLIWREAARRRETMAKIPREEFCFWTQRWSDYHDLVTRADRRGGFASDAAEREAFVNELRGLTAELDDRIDTGVEYARFFDLRASVNALLFRFTSDVEERKRLLPAIRQDRAQFYARSNMVLPRNITFEELKLLPDFQRLLAAMRPALPVTEGTYSLTALEQIDRTLGVTPGFAKDWEILLEPQKKAVSRAARATGLFSIGPRGAENCDGLAVTTAAGFAVAENIIATIDYAIEQKLRRAVERTPAVIEFGDEVEARFWFTDVSSLDGAEPPRPLRITRALLPKDDRSGIAYLQTEGHDTNAHPPIRVDRYAELQSERGNPVAVIGFPERDARMPAAFVEALLGERSGIKRLIPGLIERPFFGQLREGLDAFGVGRVTLDVSTTGGTGGGPVIDLATGALIGVNHSGRWDEDQVSKLAYAVPVWRLEEDPKSAFAELSAVPAVCKRPDRPTVAEGEDPRPQAAEALQKAFAAIGARGYDPGFLGVDLPMPVASGDQRLDYPHFSIAMDSERRLARIAAVNIDGSSLAQPGRRRLYRPDPRLDSADQTRHELYRDNQLDRGNLIRRSYPTWGEPRVAEAAADATMFFTNIVPQHRVINRRVWLELENYIQDFAALGSKRITVFAGPIFRDTDPEYRGVKVPEAFWKIVVAVTEEKQLQVAAFLIPQSFAQIDEDRLEIEPTSFDPLLSQVAVEQITRETGLDFGMLAKAQPLF